MTGAAKRKGDRAEREAGRLLTRLLGGNVIRLLGAGRKADVGDMAGVAGWAIQVADWNDIPSAVRQKPLDAEMQAINSGTEYGAALIRLRGGEFRIVMTPETWARLITSTTPPSAQQTPPVQSQSSPPEQ